MMVPTDRPARADRPKLPMSVRATLEGLTYLEIATKGPVHLDDWRAEAYKRGIGETPGAKQKAFSRARTRLLDDGLVTCNDDYYSLKKDEFILPDDQPDNTTKPDKTRHVRDVTGGVAQTDKDTTLKRCPLSGPGVRSGGDLEEKQENSFLHEKEASGDGADLHLDTPVLPGLVVNDGWSED